jgi:polyphosphate:AMP phosphotransferase
VRAMLELVELNKRLSKDEYEKVFPDLEIRLGECQRGARAAGLPVVIVFEGWDASGKGSAIGHLAQALDPRGFKAIPISAPNEEQRLRPWMWRFWKELPADGTFAIFDRSWYGRVLTERVEGFVAEADWERGYRDICDFERALTDAGAVIVKFWLHISKAEQKRRFQKLEKNPATAWKVGKGEWKRHKSYDKWLAAAEDVLERTDSACAPWTVVESTQGRFRSVKVFQTIIAAVEKELERRAANPPAAPEPMPAPTPSADDGQTVLDRVDLTLSLERAEYEEQRKVLQKRLFALEHQLYTARIPAVVAYEGWDAAGKGGTIKRLTRGLDPRGYEVIPVGPPNDTEKAHHYLWRFWRDLPKAGHITIFDRTWYGRVLVERVEGLCTEEEWRRAYDEINEFERQLTDFGTVLVKFWLHLSPQEQLKRFREREATAYKQWKITKDDWRNRKKWDKYRVAVVEMLERTSTAAAPWTILEADCKLHSRIKALRTVADALEAALQRAGRQR